jgi:hypothetical protein
MPAVHDPYEAVAAHIDSLAPRGAANSRLHSRQPDYSAMVFDAPRKQPVAKRQQQQMVVQPGIIPTYYNLSGPAPGTVAGIVLGSVAGFLLIVWLLYTLTQGGGFGGGAGRTTAMAGQEEIVVRRPRRNSHGANRSSRGSRHTQVREVSRSPRQSGGRSQIIVEERRGPPRPRSIIVEDRRRVPNDDVVEVIEEEDYRERRASRRGGYR